MRCNLLEESDRLTFGWRCDEILHPIRRDRIVAMSKIDE